VEAALVCIEVKSKLDATELRKAHENAKTVLNLDILGGNYDQYGNPMGGRTSAPRSLLFALDSDLTTSGKTEIDRYKKLLGNNYPIFASICVVNRGSWWPTENVIYDRQTKAFLKRDGKDITGEWREVWADPNHSEVLEFISGVLHFTQNIAGSRGQPPLHAYLK
jgi:hypothetical protein